MIKHQNGSTNQPAASPGTRSFRRLFLVLLIVVFAVIIIVVAYVRNPGVVKPFTVQVDNSTNQPSPDSSTATQIPSATSTNTQTETLTPTTAAAETQIQLSNRAYPPGIIFLSIFEGGHYHLFAYHPETQPLQRLTSGLWDDIHPAASPDGSWLAFTSNRDGFWDLYLLELNTGLVERLTNTPEYDAAPSWSPDSQWLVYETYTTTLTSGKEGLAEGTAASPSPDPQHGLESINLEIFICSIDSQQPAIRLTNHPDSDSSPAWSPGGRIIAFVSNRTGNDEIWLADLDQVDDRFRLAYINPGASDHNPAWSPDGKRLAWSSTVDGYQDIVIYDFSQDEPAVRTLGSGYLASWSPDGSALVVGVQSPNQEYLSGYHTDLNGVLLPFLKMPGDIDGVSWSSARLSSPLPEAFQRSAMVTPTPAWSPAITPAVELPEGRRLLIKLTDVEAPYPSLQDMADESYRGLRTALSMHLGWDFLSNLENAFVPLTSPLFPGMLNDWLYTGRAFTLNSVPMNAGWMVVVREDFGEKTYWRVYLRPRFQDGSQGRPLRQIPWNFSARFNGNPVAYEQGGVEFAELPGGYWVDFTNLAAAYGWERLPALSSWRYAVPSARFNEFILSGGMDWYHAMREIYPAEALNTPTPVLPPTYTPTITRRPTQTRTPTRTPWPSRTPTALPSVNP